MMSRVWSRVDRVERRVTKLVDRWWLVLVVVVVLVAWHEGIV